MSEGSDDRLGRLARRAPTDEAAFRQLVQACQPLVRRWAWIASGDADHAEDAAQETIVRMHRSLTTFHGEAPFTTWLYRIMRSAVTDGRRREERHRRKVERAAREFRSYAAAESIEDRLERQQRLDLVRTFWKELPPQQRIVFDLVDLQGYPPKEVAEMLDSVPATVRAHLFKARRRIRGRILDHLVGAAREERT